MTTAAALPEKKLVTPQKYFITTPGESPINVYAAAMPKVATAEAMRRYHVARNMPNVMTGALSEREVERMVKFGAEVTPSRRHEPVATSLDRVYRPLASHPHSMIDVMQHIKAPAAWKAARGKGVHIAVIDTG